MNNRDRIAIEEAAIVLGAIAERMRTNPEFALHFSHLPVPGGRPIAGFASAIGATATRYPTTWAQARRDDEAVA